MPQPKKAARFGGDAAHHNVILSNLATELFRHGRIKTTLAKAKTVQPLAERMITFAKRGDIQARRQVLTVIRDKDVVHKLFTDIGPAFTERNGGYTRVLKTGPRKGDNAAMALIELVEGRSEDGEAELTEEPRRRWSLRRSRGTVSTAAREREEDRAMAADRGDDPDEFTPEPVADESVDDEVAAAPQPHEAADDRDEDDEERPEADPAEVEARLADEDEQSTEPIANEDVPDGDSDK